MARQQFLTVTEKGFDKTLTRYRDFRQIVQNPDMSWPVRGAARVWDRNFKSEGGAVGGWKPLSEWTQRVRRSRGYGAEHPILRQSGTLHRVAVRSLVDARMPKSSSGSGARMSFSAPTRGRAILTLTGEKIKLHYGDKRRRIPARRFWYVDGAVTDEATRSLQKWYDREIARMK